MRDSLSCLDEKAKTMKKLILLFLLIPFVSIGQPQVINGIELNGRQGMSKTGDLRWEDLESSLEVFSMGKMDITKKTKEEIAKQGNRLVKLEFSHNVQAFGESNHIAIFKAIKEINGISSFMGCVVLEQGGYVYLVTASSLSNGGKAADEKAIWNIHRNFGYMIGRILSPIYAN